MEHSVTPISSVLGVAEATRAQSNHVDVEAEAKANKQRRKVQNRKNQRAHRESSPKCLTLVSSLALKDCGSKSKTRGHFRRRPHSRSGAGALTNMSITHPRAPRQNRKAQPLCTSPVNHLLLTSVHPCSHAKAPPSSESLRLPPQSVPRRP